MTYLILILLIAMTALLILDKPEPPVSFEPEHPDVAALRQMLESRTHVCIFGLRVRGGQWEAETHRGWIKTVDLLSEAEFGL